MPSPKLPLIQTRTCIEATNADLSASTFTDVNLSGAAFNNINLSEVVIDDACCSGLRITNANLDGMTINGILVTDLLAAHAARQIR